MRPCRGLPEIYTTVYDLLGGVELAFELKRYHFDSRNPVQSGREEYKLASVACMGQRQGLAPPPTLQSEDLPSGMDPLGPRQGKDEGLRDAEAAAANQRSKSKCTHYGFLMGIFYVVWGCASKTEGSR